MILYINKLLISLSPCTVTVEIGVRIVELLYIYCSFLISIPINIGESLGIFFPLLIELFTLLLEIVSKLIVEVVYHSKK